MMPTLNLSPTQIAFTGDALKTVLIDRKALPTPMKPDEHYALSQIITPDLNADFLFDFLKALDSTDRSAVFSLMDPRILSQVKKRLPTDTYLFTNLTATPAAPTAASDGDTDTDYLPYFNALAQDILAPDLSLSSFLKRYPNAPTLPLDSLLSLAEDILDTVIPELPELSGPEQFGITLKCYYALQPYMALFPDLQPALQQPISRLILSFKTFPSTEWVLKVMDQLPDYFLEMLFDALYAYDTIRSFEKRLFYCKLLQDIDHYVSANPDYNGRVLDYL